MYLCPKIHKTTTKLKILQQVRYKSNSDKSIMYHNLNKEESATAGRSCYKYTNNLSY